MLIELGPRNEGFQNLQDASFQGKVWHKIQHVL